MAERTPVSSLMRASTVTLPLETEAFTSLIAGGLVSSANAAVASKEMAARIAMRMAQDYRRSIFGLQRFRSTAERAKRAEFFLKKRSFLCALCGESFQAAAVALGDSLTETILEMPGSSIVTP